MRLVTPTGVFDWVAPDSESDFEKTIKSNADLIFDENRYYIDCKRRISRGKKSSIPDAYLIDLARTEPRLYFIENELVVHDPFKHIGVQLLEFSHAHSKSGRQLKAVLFEEVSKYPEVVKACGRYAISLGATRFQMVLLTLREGKFAVLAAVIMGFGRAFSEVGLALMVGGNIRGFTRTLTTTISLETSKGDLELSIALGIILLLIALVINVTLNRLQQR